MREPARRRLSVVVDAFVTECRAIVTARLAVYPVFVMGRPETMNVGLGRTSLVVAASDGPGG